MIEKPKPIFGESALSLRTRRTATYSFAKANRFGLSYKKEDPRLVVLPSTLDRRGTSLGYGGRWQPDTHTQDNPSPGAYEVRSSLNSGHGMRLKEETVKKGENFHMPGPGTYDFLEPFGKNSRKVGFRSKHYDVKYSSSPSPGSYSPKTLESLVGKGVNFGYGQREFMRYVANDTPGPGCYETLSSFSRTYKKKK